MCSFILQGQTPNSQIYVDYLNTLTEKQFNELSVDELHEFLFPVSTGETDVIMTTKEPKWHHVGNLPHDEQFVQKKNHFASYFIYFINKSALKYFKR